MAAKRELVRRGDRIGLPTGPELSNRQRNMLDNVACRGLAPPARRRRRLKEFAEQHGYTLKDLEPLVQVAVDEGQLVRLSPQMTMDRRRSSRCGSAWPIISADHPTAKVGEIREQWGITRKHAVPIFEFFDQCQITSRAGDLRSAGPRMSIPVDEAIT